MKDNHTKAKFITTLAALFIGLGFVGQANAEVFYSNILRGVQNTVSYFNTKTAEVADDVPFTGSHLVTSFRMGYRSPEPVHATFRFYGVNPSSGLNGQLIAQISRDLPAASFANPTITLDATEQFIFTAEPGLIGRGLSGGWYSIQFESSTGAPLPYGLSAQLGDGASLDGLLVVASGTTFNLLDPSGLIPVSFFLEMSNAAGTVITPPSGSVIPKVADLTLFPSTVTVGTSVNATVTLSSQAPTGGVEVEFSTSSKGIYFSKSKIVVKEGRTKGAVRIFTSKRVFGKRKDKATALIVAKDNAGNSTEATLTITK